MGRESNEVAPNTLGVLLILFPLLSTTITKKYLYNGFQYFHTEMLEKSLTFSKEINLSYFLETVITNGEKIVDKFPEREIFKKKSCC